MKSPTSFYRIIFPNVMREQKLMIPEDFAEVHRNELSTTAKLTVPSGLIWDIRLEKSGKKLWFHDGWKEFAEHHSIGCWFFILLKYEGNSKFNVHIFDLTATEISYPITNRKRNSVSDEGDGEGDDSVEILSSSGAEPPDVPSGQQVPYEGFKEKATGERCSRNKRCELDDGEEITIYENVTASPIGKQRAHEMPQKKKNLENYFQGAESIRRSAISKSYFANCPKRAAKDGQHSMKGIVWVESTAQKEDEQQPTVKIEDVELSVPTPSFKVDEATTSKTENPSLKVVLRPYNVRSGSIVHVPLQFIRDHLNISSNAAVTLTYGVWKWEVLLILTKTSHCLSRGWSTFVEDNQLSVGDICVFELIEVKNITFKVSILRGCETFDKPIGERRSAPFLQNMSKFAPEFSTRIKVHGSHCSSMERMRSGLDHLVRNKRRKLDDGEETTEFENVTATPQEKQRAYEMPRSRLANPTQRASKDGQHSTEDEQQPTVKIEDDEDFSVSELTKSQLVTAPGRKTAINEAVTSKTENPSFKVILKPYHFRSGSVVYVSARFIRDHLNISSDATVTLTFGGRQWKVILIYSDVTHCLSRGWSTFVEENQLSVGDICVFELIKVRNIAFKVSIVRGGEVSGKATGERCINSKSCLANPAEGTLHVESTTRKQDKQQLTVKNEEVEMPVPTTPRPTIAINKATDFKPENPSFAVVLQPYNIVSGSIVNLSAKFIRDYLNIYSNAIATLTFGGRQWKVLLFHSNGRHRLSRGWSTFVLDNQLSVGNVCVFELIEVKNITFKVSIFRDGEGATGTMSSEVKHKSCVYF